MMMPMTMHEAIQVISPCGHTFVVEVPGPSGQATADCTCGKPLMLVWTPDSVRATDLNYFLHQQDPRWPADGASTGYLEV